MITDFDLLLAETARTFDVSTEEILGPSRHQTISLARHVVMALWSDHHSFPESAARCRRVCHNSAMYAREKVLNRAELDANFARLVAGISNRCQHSNPSNSTGIEPEPLEKTA
jgi:chromosomal replication initiation ATPase DnaA